MDVHVDADSDAYAYACRSSGAPLPRCSYSGTRASQTPSRTPAGRPLFDTVSSGVPPYVRTGLTATGSSQANAFPLTNNTYHEFTTVTSGTGAIVPAPSIPSYFTIQNSGEASLAIYPQSGGTIDLGDVNAPLCTRPAGGVALCALRRR